VFVQKNNVFVLGYIVHVVLECRKMCWRDRAVILLGLFIHGIIIYSFL